jgi:hypothetical protein
MQSNRERRSATAVAQRIGGGWLWCASMAWRSKNFVRGFLAAVSRPLLATCFSLCDLRLFVIKRIFSLRTKNTAPQTQTLAAAARRAEAPRPRSGRGSRLRDRSLDLRVCTG